MGGNAARAELHFIDENHTIIQFDENQVQYRTGTVAHALTSTIAVVDHGNRVEYARTLRSLSVLSRVEFPGLFHTEKISGKVLVAAIGGVDDSLVLALRELGIDAYGTDIFLYPHQRKREFLFQADLRDTNLVENQFDVVLMSWGPLTYSESESTSVMENVLQETRRILVPGGKLLVAPVNLEVLGPVIDRVVGLKYTVVKSKHTDPFDASPSYITIVKKKPLVDRIVDCVHALTVGNKD